MTSRNLSQDSACRLPTATRVEFRLATAQDWRVSRSSSGSDPQRKRSRWLTRGLFFSFPLFFSLFPSEFKKRKREIGVKRQFLEFIALQVVHFGFLLFIWSRDSNNRESNHFASVLGWWWHLFGLAFFVGGHSLRFLGEVWSLLLFFISSSLIQGFFRSFLILSLLSCPVGVWGCVCSLELFIFVVSVDFHSYQVVSLVLGWDHRFISLLYSDQDW